MKEREVKKEVVGGTWTHLFACSPLLHDLYRHLHQDRKRQSTANDYVETKKNKLNYSNCFWQHCDLFELFTFSQALSSPYNTDLQFMTSSESSSRGEVWRAEETVWMSREEWRKQALRVRGGVLCWDMSGLNKGEHGNEHVPSQVLWFSLSVY